MRLVIDANVVISALIADSKTRELMVTLDHTLLTPAFVREELETYRGMIVEKSGMAPDRVEQFLDLLFRYIEIVPVEEFHSSIPEAEAEIGHVDPNDVLYLACAIACDAAIWSDDADFDEQELVRRTRRRASSRKSRGDDLGTGPVTALF